MMHNGQPHKLLYLITRSDLGGAQGNVLALIKAFCLEYEVHLATGETGALTDDASTLGVSIHILPNLTRNIQPFGDLRGLKQCINLIDHVQPNLIHAHSSKAGVIARLAGWSRRVPTVFTAHGWGFAPGVPITRRIVAFLVEKVIALITDQIICVSESDRQLALKLGIGRADSVTSIHCGIASNFVQAADTVPQPMECVPLLQIPPRPSNPSPKTGEGATNQILSVPLEDEFRVKSAKLGCPMRLIMVARFSKQKDQATLLRAVAKLADPSICVNFVGSGPTLESCQFLAKELKIDKKVTFLGDRRDVTNLLAQSQVFVLSTHYEGLPISILEAMRAGLPVIASNVNGIPEQIEDHKTGLLIPPRDPEALAQAIQALNNSPELRYRMGIAARIKFEQEFTVEKMVNQTQQVYQKIIKKYSHSIL
jgi:glycosyltransferase involved in cell wall biosynthesis